MRRIECFNGIALFVIVVFAVFAVFVRALLCFGCGFRPSKEIVVSFSIHPMADCCVSFAISTVYCCLSIPLTSVADCCVFPSTLVH